MKAAKKTASGGPKRGYLDGQFLIAMPGMQDTRFARSVVYLCAHSSDGAMGIMINQPAPQITFRDLLVQLNVIPGGRDPAAGARRPHAGPSAAGRSRPAAASCCTAPITSSRIRRCRSTSICLTATLEILKAIAVGTGPQNAMLALGYAGWAPGQLETEIQANGWLHCPATPELIFDTDIDAKYERALGMIGIDPDAVGRSRSRLSDRRVG